MTVRAYFGKNHPEWTIVHPMYRPEGLGPFLPYFLHVNDPRKAAEQFNDRYKFGGWRPRKGDPTKINGKDELLYPGDPPLPPLAKCKLRDETIILYQSDFVAIIQPDRSFEVARLD